MHAALGFAGLRTRESRRARLQQPNRVPRPAAKRPAASTAREKRCQRRSAGRRRRTGIHARLPPPRARCGSRGNRTIRKMDGDRRDHRSPHRRSGGAQHDQAASSTWSTSSPAPCSSRASLIQQLDDALWRAGERFDRSSGSGSHALPTEATPSAPASNSASRRAVGRGRGTRGWRCSAREGGDVSRQGSMRNSWRWSRRASCATWAASPCSIRACARTAGWSWPTCNMLAERLPLLPPFRWRLKQVPLGLDYPYWIDDPDFDLEYHVRESRWRPRRRTRSLGSRSRGSSPDPSIGRGRCGRCT